MEGLHLMVDVDDDDEGGEQLGIGMVDELLTVEVVEQLKGVDIVVVVVVRPKSPVTLSSSDRNDPFS